MSSNLPYESSNSSLQKDFRDGVLTLLRNQLVSLLKVISLEDDGKEVSPTDISVSFDSNTELPLQAKVKFSNKHLYQDAKAYEYMEPRICMISNFLKLISGFTLFYENGKTVGVNGFSFRKLDYWANYQVGGIVDCLGCICSYCDANCEFCFRHSSPLTRNGNKMLSLKEAQTLLKYYDPETGVGLPLPLHDTGEIFLNRELLAIFQEVRKKDTGALINDITTHGGHLTQSRLDVLATLKPIFIVVSLNSSDLEKRSKVMNQKTVSLGIEAFQGLRERGIQFIGSIVPWATNGIEDLRSSILYLDRYEPYLIRICLPSYTQLNYAEPPFDSERFWSEVGDLVTALQNEIKTPILVQPSWYLRKELWAHVDGVIKNSPADKSDLRFGDRITKVNNKNILSRQDVRNALYKISKDGINAEIEYERGGAIRKTKLENSLTIDTDAYPFKPIGYSFDYSSCFGLHFIDSFPLENILAIGQVISRYPTAQRILVFSTELGKPMFVKMLSNVISVDSLNIPIEKIRVAVAPHRYWGGNIVIGDINVIGDYVYRLEQLMATGYYPDLVIIPSSFTMGTWGLDIRGESYLEIERRTGCTTELVKTTPVKI